MPTGTLTTEYQNSKSRARAVVENSQRGKYTILLVSCINIYGHMGQQRLGVPSMRLSANADVVARQVMGATLSTTSMSQFQDLP